MRIAKACRDRHFEDMRRAITVSLMVVAMIRPHCPSRLISFRFQAAPADPENHNYSLDNQFVGVIMRPSQPRTQIIISKLFATKCRF